MVVAEVTVLPVGTASPGVSPYIKAAVRALEGSGLRCTTNAMGTTVEAQSAEDLYTALSLAQQAVFDMGAGRVYTVVKMDERRDVESSAEEMVREVREA